MVRDYIELAYFYSKFQQHCFFLIRIHSMQEQLLRHGVEEKEPQKD